MHHVRTRTHLTLCRVSPPRSELRTPKRLTRLDPPCPAIAPSVPRTQETMTSHYLALTRSKHKALTHFSPTNSSHLYRVSCSRHLFRRRIVPWARCQVFTRPLKMHLPLVHRSTHLRLRCFPTTAQLRLHRQHHLTVFLLHHKLLDHQVLHHNPLHHPACQVRCQARLQRISSQASSECYRRAHTNKPLDNHMMT